MKSFAFVICLVSLSIQIGSPSQLVSQVLGLATVLPGVFDNAEESPVPKVFRHIFPHTANGQGGGLAITSSVILINNSGTDAHGTIHFRDTGGLDFEVVTDRGQGSQFEFSLFPGETYRLQTDGSGSTKSGWIEVVSDIELAGSGTFTVYDTRHSPADSHEPGAFLSEVGIADSTPSTSVMVYVDTTDGRNAGFGVCNPSESETVQLRYELRELDGTVLESRQDTLGPLQQKSEFVTQTFGPAGGTFPAAVNFANFEGLFVIESDGSPVAVTNLRTKGVQFTSLPSAPWVEETNRATQLYFPRLGDGIFGPYRFQTGFVLMNNSAEPLSGTAHLFTDDGHDWSLPGEGNPGSEILFAVPAGGAWSLTSDGSTNPGVIGWARVETDGPLAGTAVFTVSETATGGFVSEVGIPDSPVSPKLTVFAEVDGEIDTGLGITNVYDGEQSFLIRLIRNPEGDRSNCMVSEGFITGQFGELVAEKRMSLGARSHTGFFITQVFPEVPEIKQRNFRGRVEVIPPGPGVTLRTRGPFWTSLPAAPFLTAAFEPEADLLVSTRTGYGEILAGSSPYFCLVVEQDSGESGVARAAFEFDDLDIDLSQIEDVWELAGYSITEAYGYQAIGRLFLVEESSGSATFFTSLSIDGTVQACPFIGEITRLEGGGLRFEVRNNPGGNLTVGNIQSKLCFDPGWIQVPDGSGEVVPILREFESFEQTLQAGDSLSASSCSSFRLKEILSDPRIDAVFPSRAVGGSELEVRGHGFGVSPGDNRVNIQGFDSYEAEILEVGPDRLKVRLPDEFKGSGGQAFLSVAAMGKTSNRYRLEIPFSPITNLTLDSLQAGAVTGLSFEMTQSEDEIGFMAVFVEPSAGQWVADGWTPGESLGTFTVRRYTTGEYLSGTYDLVVESSAPDLLKLSVVKAPYDPIYSVEITNTGTPQLLLYPIEIENTQVLQNDMEMTLDFAKAIFQLPAGSGASLDFQIEIHSTPERNLALGSAMIAGRRQDATTQ